MTAEPNSVDITDLPELARLAEQVRESGTPTLLRRGSEIVAVLAPAGSETASESTTSEPASAGDDLQWLVDLIGIGADEEPPGGPTDVSANKYKYLADAKLGKTRPPAER